MTRTAPPKLRNYLIGGFVLALNAGYINAIGILSPLHQVVSHLTGTSSNLAISLINTPAQSYKLILIILSFMSGCVISGAIIDSQQLRLGRRYGVILLMESFLLLFATFFLENKSNVGLYLTTLACGLQNAMATSYTGAVIRTTHMTGLITDFGIHLGNLLAGRPVAYWRFWVYFILFAGFVFGGVLGTYAYSILEISALYGSALLCAILGLSHWIWRQMKIMRGKPPQLEEADAEEATAESQL